MRTNLSERYSRSTWAFIRKLLPLKVRATSNTQSPTRNPRSMGSILTSLNGSHCPPKYAT